VQKITSGGGGAFLHPTHEEGVSVLSEEAVTETARARTFALKCTYPDMKRSARLAWQNLNFPFRNPRFGIVPACIYLLSCWLVGASVSDAVPSSPWRALRLTADAFAANPGLALWAMGIMGMFLAFTDTHSRAYRVIGGLSHAAAHLAAMFYIGWSARVLGDQIFRTDGFLRAITTATVIFGAGWVAGSFIVGFYLLISVNVFGRHSEEAFSGLRIEDYKQFLRLHINREGQLTIWPIKIERVPRRWRPRQPADATQSHVVPETPIVCELIEPPIVVR
jgi:hypothetical protein